MKEEKSKPFDWQELLNRLEEKTGWSASFDHDWDSFIFWQPISWRNFTFIEIEYEYTEYSVSHELNLALLGFHLQIRYYKDHN